MYERIKLRSKSIEKKTIKLCERNNFVCMYGKIINLKQGNIHERDKHKYFFTKNI